MGRYNLTVVSTLEIKNVNGIFFGFPFLYPSIWIFQPSEESNKTHTTKMKKKEGKITLSSRCSTSDNMAFIFRNISSAHQLPRDDMPLRKTETVIASKTSEPIILGSNPIEKSIPVLIFTTTVSAIKVESENFLSCFFFVWNFCFVRKRGKRTKSFLFYDRDYLSWNCPCVSLIAWRKRKLRTLLKFRLHLIAPLR